MVLHIASTSFDDVTTDGCVRVDADTTKKEIKSIAFLI